MAAFPSAPISSGGFMPPNTTDYRGIASRIGSKVANVAQAGGNLWDKVQAYDQLKKKMANDKAFRTQVLSEVMRAMDKAGVPPDSSQRQIAQSTTLTGEDSWEGYLKGVEYKKAVDFAIDNGIGTMPLYGQKDFPTVYKAEVNEKKARDLTEKYKKAGESAKTKEGFLAAGAKETLEAPPPAAEIIAAGRPQAITPLQERKLENEVKKIKVSLRRAMDSSKASGRAATRDAISGLNTQFKQAQALIERKKQDIADLKKELADDVKNASNMNMLGYTPMTEEEKNKTKNQIADLQAEIKMSEPELTILKKSIETINDQRTRGEVTRQYGAAEGPIQAQEAVGAAPGPTPIQAPQVTPRQPSTAGVMTAEQARVKLKATGKYSDQQIEEYIRKKELR